MFRTYNDLVLQFTQSLRDDMLYVFPFRYKLIPRSIIVECHIALGVT